jgi:uncharacterized protein (DUF1684 family)
MTLRAPFSSVVFAAALVLALGACRQNAGDAAKAEKTEPSTPAAELPAQEEATPEGQAKHAAEFAEFRKFREDRLRLPTSWLTLVGLYWLHEGENSAGSAPTAEIVFPPSLPTGLGTFVVPGPEGAAAELRTTGGFTVTVDGKEGEPATEKQTRVPMFADSSGKATIVRSGSVSFYLIDRQGKVGVRIKDSEAETFKTFKGIETWPLSWEWRVRARFEPAPAGRKIKVPNVLGQVSEEASAGIVYFEKEGRTWQLEALEGDGEDGLYFIFGDGSNGKGSYGGGRFLDAKVEGGDRKKATTAIVDFNLAYNPPCVFSPYATCPLPPAESKISLPIEAGEKVWGQH